ncbi:hypothetical protein ACWC0C_01270 [Streptomyces sp. NPDC001709]
MRPRIRYALAALPGAALFVGAALLGAWADGHHHVWLSRVCVMGASAGAVVAVGGVVLAVVPRSWRPFLFPNWPRGDRLWGPRRRKLPDDWRR